MGCKISECPIHCEWDDWVLGECSKSCGGGLLTQTRQVKAEAEHGGEECPGVDTLEVSCNIDECPRCACKDLVVASGYGNCQKKWIGTPICYVELPSSCSDLQPSSYVPEDKWSYEACSQTA